MDEGSVQMRRMEKWIGWMDGWMDIQAEKSEKIKNQIEMKLKVVQHGLSRIIGLLVSPSLFSFFSFLFLSFLCVIGKSHQLLAPE